MSDFFFDFACIDTSFAQKKYALLVGINKYYDRPGVLHRSLLRGCVNDALAIKGMLINRFGFNANDIIVLTDEKASRKNVENSFSTILQKVKAEDAFVFYFSGHGVWMDNVGQSESDQKLKMGMNQAIVLSDLYSDNLGCLLRDINIKRYFNKFVDKKVISTSIFDCCFSGHLAQGFSLSMHNPYQSLTPSFSQKSIYFDEILYSFEQNNDSASKINNPVWDSLFSKILSDSSLETKAFNLKSKLIVNDPAFVVRPSERPSSMFLSVSATDEYQKGEEMKDANGDYHGVFTKALLQTMDESTSNVSFKNIFYKLQKLIKNNGFSQTPVHFQDPARLSLNLIGVNPGSFKNNISARYKVKENSLYLLDAGKTAGLAIGNILSLNGKTNSVQLQIESIKQDVSFARIIKGTQAQIKKGDVFVRTSNFIKTKPLIKLYLSLAPITGNTLEKQMKEKIIPLSKLSNYRDYKNWYVTDTLDYLFYDKKGLMNNAVIERFLNGQNEKPFFAFLPLSENVLKEFKSKIRQNQTFELVTSAAQADLVLYLNYSTANGGEYIFTWNKDILNHKGSPLIFYSNHFVLQKMPTNSKEIKSLTNSLYAMTVEMATQYTGIWLNEHKKQAKHD
ncbi:MAG: caspase family protein [Sphingobacteriales bacterium]|nr:caspase family protein [Sphingobacteriales bacterium]